MNRLSSSSFAGRRQFLRDGLRYIVLGGLAAASVKLAGRRAALPAGQVCVSAGICRGCEAWDDCGLPQALSAKAAAHSSSRQP